MLRYQLIAAGQQYPESKSLVYDFGSGAGGSRAPQGEFDPLPGSVDGGAVFGYGAALNEPGLQRIAQQLGVPYDIETMVSHWPGRRRVPMPPLSRPGPIALRMSSTARNCIGCSPRWPRC